MISSKNKTFINWNKKANQTILIKYVTWTKIKNKSLRIALVLCVSLWLSQNPKVFAGNLLDYVGSQAQYLHTLLALTQTNKVESQQHAQRLHWAEMALEALRNVIKNNPGNTYKRITEAKLIYS